MLNSAALQQRLQKLQQTIMHLPIAIVMSPDGLVMASSSNNIDQGELLAAMVSSVLTQNSQVLGELAYGEVQTQMLLGSKGGVFIRNINQELILALQLEPGANIGRIYQAASELVQALNQAA